MNLNTIHYDHFDTMVELSSVSSGCDRKWSSGLCKHPELAYVLLVTSSRKDPDLCLEAGRKRGTLTEQASNKMEQGVFKHFQHVQTIQTEAFFQHTDFLSGSETELASHRASRTGCFRFIVQVKIVNRNACEDLWRSVKPHSDFVPIIATYCNWYFSAWNLWEALQKSPPKSGRDQEMRLCVN